MLRKQLNLHCPYCKKVCNKNTDESIITKRGTIQYFHGKCFIEKCRKNNN